MTSILSHTQTDYPAYHARIEELFDACSGNRHLREGAIYTVSPESIEVGDFWGAKLGIHISATDDIYVNGGVCLAAPVVSLFAEKTLTLGLQENRASPISTRIYAPFQLSITAQRLLVGNFEWLTEPKHVFLKCDEITLLQGAEKSSEAFGLFRRWAETRNISVKSSGASSLMR